MDITIDLYRYEELLKTEFVARMLMRSIEDRAERYEGYSHTEVRMLCELFSTKKESEE